MIKIDGITRRWGDFVISDVSLEIKDGEYFVFLGPTGAGKTLLLELLAGFYEPEKGNIYKYDMDISDQPPQERGFGFVYQDYMLFPHLDVKGNIAYGLRVNRKSDINRKVEDIAEKVGVSELLSRVPSTLSGGEKQRVSIARAMALEPDVLLLDEPFGSVDDQTGKKLRSLMKELHKKVGCTIIQVTHDQEEAVVLGDRIAVMKDGAIQQVGTPENIMRKPRSKFVAEFVGTGNIFHGTAKKEKDVSMVDVGNVEIASSYTLEGDVTLTIRPEDIILAEEPFESSARNNFKGRVKEINDRGIYHEIIVDVGVPLIVYITRQSIDNLELKKGKEIWTVFKASTVHLFKE
ncbi:MAG: tungstate ABC transporter ATP-binding protein WtpC [Candidatus Saliniplasma sp.]